MESNATTTSGRIASANCQRPTLADRIRAAREAAGLNQSELGRAVGVSPQAVQHWEAGGGIRHDRLAVVAAALRVPPAALLFGDGDDLQATLVQLLARVDALEVRLDLFTGRMPDRRRHRRRADG